jgi:tetratricopeptide (TPR) repeat protein
LHPGEEINHNDCLVKGIRICRFITRSDVIFHHGLNRDMSDLEVVVDSLEKSGIKPQFKRQLSDGTLVDADTSYLDLLNAKTRIANTAQTIHGASQVDKTLWAIEMKNFANMLYEHKRYREALEKYMECLTASNFGKSSSSEGMTQEATDSNIDDMIVPVLCNMAACCLQLQDWGKASRFCEEALKLRPKCLKATIRYCKALFHLGEYNLVVKKLKEVTIADEEKEKRQIEDLMRQARQGIATEKKAEERQKKALMKAFRTEKPSQSSAVEKETSSAEAHAQSIFQRCIAYILSIMLLILDWFTRKLKSS